VLGDHDSALDLHRRALRLRQQAGDKAGAQASCYSLALCYESLGQRDLAEKMLFYSRHGPPPLDTAGPGWPVA
jgi:tetratricopeptide (TPR) repeat protein